MEESFKLSGELKKILFFNEENSYYIAVLENDQKICGQYFDTDLNKLIGVEIILTGNWNTHKKYGVQFVFTSLEVKEAEIYFFFNKNSKRYIKKNSTRTYK